MTCLTLVHDDYGSMAEASEARAILGPYPDALTADQAGETFHNALPPDLRNDIWWTIVNIPTIPPDPVQEAKTYAKGLT